VLHARPIVQRADCDTVESGTRAPPIAAEPFGAQLRKLCPDLQLHHLSSLSSSPPSRNRPPTSNSAHATAIEPNIGAHGTSSSDGPIYAGEF
jgi:hypothetical protein